MDIAVRLEGGIGDHLLANRFVHAIKEKYPDDNLLIFSDPSQDFGQLALMKQCWPSIYKNAIQSPGRVSNKFKIKSQYGVEIYNAAIENQPDSIKKLYEGADKFYDLCLDRLEWLDYDFDWFRYFYFFPKLERLPTSSAPVKKPFVLANLFSRKDSPYTLKKEYVERLVKDLSDSHYTIIVTTEENRHYYDFCANNPSIEIRVADLNETFYLASQCSAFIGLDSGVRVMPYYFGKPTFYFSPYCPEYGNPLISHYVRWMVYEKNTLPLESDISDVLRMLKNTIENRVSSIIPGLCKTNKDGILIKRIYEVLPDC